MPKDEVSLKEFIQVQITGLKTEVLLELKSIREEVRKNEEQNSKRRHETLALVTEIKARHEQHEQEMETRDRKQGLINTRIFIWLTTLSVLLVFALIGLASEAGSLLGIIINAF